MNFYSLSYKSNDVLLILLKLFQIWPLLYIFSWFLCPFDVHHQCVCVCVCVCVCEVKVDQLCPTLCDPMDSSVHGNSPDKDTGVGCHALLQRIFPTQQLISGLLHCRWILYLPSHQGSPCVWKRENKQKRVGESEKAVTLLHTSYPSPMIIYFSKSPVSFYWRMLLLYTRFAHYCESKQAIIVSSPLSRQSEEIHIFIPTHAYTHTYRCFLYVNVWNGTILKLSMSS